jgi:hypothetical protein
MRKRINISEFEDQKLQVNTLIHHKKKGGEHSMQKNYNLMAYIHSII